MNYLKKISFAAFLMIVAVSACKPLNGGNESGGNNSGGRRSVSISGTILSSSKVNYDEEENPTVGGTGLKLTWNENDLVFGYIMTDDQPETFVYKVQSVKEGGKQAEFAYVSGHELVDLDNGKTAYIIGRNGEVPSDYAGGDYPVDLSQQNDGTLASVNNYAYICASGTIAKNKLSLKFSNQFAIFKFHKISGLKENKSYEVLLSGTGLRSKGKIAASDGGFGFVSSDEDLGSVRILRATDSEGTMDDLYFVVPSGYKVTSLSLSANDDMNHFEKLLIQKEYQIETSKFVVATKDGSPAEIQLEKSDRLLSYLPGKFTVDDAGKKVQFSRGNLFAVGDNTSATFHFEDNQYSFRTHVLNHANCLFGKTWTDTPENSYGMFEWKNSNGFNSIHITTIAFSEHSSITNEFVDWGTVIDESDKAGMEWFTLSMEQWQYLFNKDHHNYAASEIVGLTKHNNAKVDFVRGIVLAPDPSSVIEPKYTLSDWEIAQQNGYVFFPAAGFSVWNHTGNITDVNNWNSNEIGDVHRGNCYYWTSSVSAEQKSDSELGAKWDKTYWPYCWQSEIGDNGILKNLYFGERKSLPANENYPPHAAEACAVRLVMNALPESDPKLEDLNFEEF